MWNSLDLKCPSKDLTKYLPHEKYLIEEIQNLVTVLTSSADILTSENPLWKEMEVLHNIQIKYKRILRCDKCLVFLHRISHCLKKMVLLNLSKSYLDLAERFLTGFGLQDSSITVRLPSRQQLEYVLIRTLSASKLICEGIKYSRETFCYLIQKLKIGHLILDLVMAASVTARLNLMLKGILEQLCTMYEQVLSWRYKLKRGTHQWSEKLNFPQDLKKWLETLESEFLKPFPMSKDDLNILSSVLKSKNGNKDSDTDSVIVINEVNSDGVAVSERIKNGNDTDYGEVIPRKKSKKNDCLTNVQKSLLQKIIRIRTLDDLEDIWNDINSFSGEHLPKTFSARKIEIISKFFLEIRKVLSKKNLNKKSDKHRGFLKKALAVFSKHLGFSHNQIEICQNEPIISNKPNLTERKLEPVKTLKELKVLYQQLCNILQSSNQFEKHRKLEKIFKRRRTDIKLLKQSGEKNTAKKLVFCTSKVFLTLCQK